MLIEEVKENIIDRYDPDDVCEALHISTEDLLNAFEDKLVQYINAFEDDLEPDIIEYFKASGDRDD